MFQVTKKSNAGGIEALKKRMEALKNDIAVGVFKDSGTYIDGTKVVFVAQIHEFGSKKRNIPKRSFLRATAQKKKSDIKTKLKSAAKNVINGAKASTENKKIGAWFAGEVKMTIRHGGIPFVSNATATIKAKDGNDTPLRASGLLMKSVTWQEK